jgi:hypothetical protein
VESGMRNLTAVYCPQVLMESQAHQESREHRDSRVSKTCRGNA